MNCNNKDCKNTFHSCSSCSIEESWERGFCSLLCAQKHKQDVLALVSIRTKIPISTIELLLSEISKESCYFFEL